MRDVSQSYNDTTEGILDSGSTHVLSFSKSDFVKINPKPTVRLNAVDGQV